MRNDRRDGDGGLRLGSGMPAPEEGQSGVIQGLDADGETVDAGGAERAKAFRLGPGGIGLERDFHVVHRGPETPSGVDQSGDCLRLMSDGVPPPKNMLVTVRPGTSSAKCSSSAIRAARQRRCSTAAATWLLKSQ